MLLRDHPAYDSKACALVCAICRAEGGIFECMDAGVFEGHFLRHAVSQELAEAFLSRQTYLELARKRGWSHRRRRT